MPLIKSKSKKAFEHNLKAELEAGKPKDQSLAIAYSVQRKNKPKKMAAGGPVADEEAMESPEHEASESPEAEKAEHSEVSIDSLTPEEIAMIHEHRAHEAMESPEEEAAEHTEDEMEEDEHPSVASAIMAKRKKMANGGMVDLNKNSEEDLNNEDQMSFKAGLKEQYDLDQLDPQPMDSNEHGDEIDSDKHDMISMIRKKIASKRSK